MHKSVLVLLALLLMACTAGVATAADVTAAQKSLLGAEKSASAALSQTVAPGGSGDLDFYWYYTSNHAPLAYKYIQLFESKNGGSWTYVTSGYTNGNGYIGWYVKRPTGNTYRFRTKYGSTWGSTIYTIKFGNSIPRASFSASPTWGLEYSTNFRFVGSSSGGTPYRWSWSFGDGSSGSGQTVYHRYTHYGSKTVKLTVYFTNGYWASQTRYNYIWVD